MIELLPAFFAASAVVVSAAGASVGALSKAVCLRLPQFKGHRPAMRLLLGIAAAETVIMSISLALALVVVGPYATPQLENKAIFFTALFSSSAVFYIAFAWLPNLYLVRRISPVSNGSGNTFAELVWAGLLASMTPCAVVFMTVWLCLYCFR
jgi:hypothetical protein